jgi:hypothetical protein
MSTILNVNESKYQRNSISTKLNVTEVKEFEVNETHKLKTIIKIANETKEVKLKERKKKKKKKKDARTLNQTAVLWQRHFQVYAKGATLAVLDCKASGTTLAVSDCKASGIMERLAPETTVQTTSQHPTGDKPTSDRRRTNILQATSQHPTVRNNRSTVGNEKKAGRQHPTRGNKRSGVPHTLATTCTRLAVSNTCCACWCVL